MDFTKLVPVEWSSRRVLTTAQLADFYKCAVENIRDNFRKNKDRFVEGKHYFKLEGADLKAFRDYTENFRLVEGDYAETFPLVGLRAPSIYLWTERGAARHAKMLSTDKAWDIFEELEDNYFNRNTSVAVPAVKREPNPRRSDGQFKDARVYVLEFDNRAIKIGQSSDVDKRKSSVSGKSKLIVKRTYFTPYMPRKVARLIEKACHKIFSSYRIDGEFFSAEFEKVCEVIDCFVNVVAALPLVTKVERGEKLLKIADMMSNIPERQKILTESAKLFAGKNLN